MAVLFISDSGGEFDDGVAVPGLTRQQATQAPAMLALLKELEQAVDNDELRTRIRVAIEKAAPPKPAVQKRRSSW